MFQSFFILLLLLPLSVEIYSQSIDSVSMNADSYFIVDTIQIIGNDITEDFVILDELTFSQGDSVTTVELDYNRERIYSLGIFTSVKIIPLQSNQLNIIEINVY